MLLSQTCWASTFDIHLYPYMYLVYNVLSKHAQEIVCIKCIWSFRFLHWSFTVLLILIYSVLKKSNFKKCSLTFFFLKLYVLLLNCKVVDILMGSFTVFNSINMCISTHFLFLPFIGWLGASLRIVQHRLLINWQRYLSKCFFMKECRGDRSIEISQRKQQSEREREIQHPPPNPYLQV